MRELPRTMRIPGTDATLELIEQEDGTALLVAAGRVYLLRRGPASEIDNGFVRTVELANGNTLVRRVTTGDASWTEEYQLDGEGRPVRVDGVLIERDAEGRVRSCTGPDGAWMYGYAGGRLVRIVTPTAVRRVEWEGERPARVVQNGVAFEITTETCEPATAFNRDALGRVWTETDPDGRVLRTWLWDGFFCFARIDGEPGDDVAAVFSLDPTGTPVRIITRDGSARVPRDAFGEALLEHAGVPGLFGGVLRDGRVHYAGRAVDPRAGVFTTADPCDGGSDDPRRTDGWNGPLPVETEYGRYAVCRNDPIGRADPTGYVSWGVILSDFTWSMQNNTLAIFGLDLSINFWLSFLTLCVDRSRGYFTTFQFETGSRQQTWALLRQGLLSRSGRAWTFQHLLHDSAADLDSLEVCRVLAPAARYEPTHYGSVLRFTPAGGTASILSGDQNVDGGADWSRHGGTAEAVFPGSSIPWFPSGGVHLDTPLPGPRPGDTGTVVELEPAGPVASGTGSGLPSIVIPGTGYGLALGDLLLLTDAPLQAEIIAVQAATESSGLTTVVLATPPATVGNTGLRVRRLENAPVSNESITQGPDAATLDLAAAPAPAPAPDYEISDPLRFSQGGTVFGAGLIQRFETRLRMGSTVPDPGANGEVFPTSPGNTGNGTLTTNPNQVQVTGGSPAPGVNQAVLVSTPTTSIPCIVLGSDNADPPLLTLDRSVSALGGDGDPVGWTRLVTQATAITASAGTVTTSGDTITYTPTLERNAPAVGSTLVIASDTVRVARTVSAIVGDLIVCEQPIGATGAISVDRMRVASGGAAIDRNNLSLTQQLTLALANPTPVSADALRLIDIGATSVAGIATSATYTAITDVTATVAVGGGGQAISAGAVVWLGPATGGEFALVRRVIARITLDREIAELDGATDLFAVRVQQAGPRFDARRIDDLIVAVDATVGGAPWQLARFRPGQLVLLRWTGATGMYRVGSVEPNGSTITLEGGPDLPTPTPSLTVERLDLGYVLNGTLIDTTQVRLTDPGTGGSRHGIRGTARTVSGATDVTELTVETWRTNTFANGDLLAIVAGDVTHPAVIASFTLDVVFSQPPAIPPSATTPVPIAVVNNTPAPTTQTGFAQQFRVESGNAAITIFDAPFTPVPANLIVAVPYSATSNSVQVTVSSGTTLVPDEPEFGELERRQSLVDHELMHTVQSATWGPALFCWFPLMIMQGIAEFTTDLELPRFSPNAKAKIEEDNRGRFLIIEDNPTSVEFESGDVVQVTRRLQNQDTLFLDEKVSDTRFRVRPISTGSSLEPGPVIASPGDQEMLGSVGALVRFENDAIFLDIPDAGGLTFSQGGQAKVYHGDPLAALRIGTVDPQNANRFIITDGPAVSGGELLVRRENSSNPFWRTFFDIMSFTTGGALTTLMFSLTWGWVLYGMFKLFYAAGRAIFTSDEKHTATVDENDRTKINFGTALPESFGDVSHIEIRSGDSPTVRRIEQRNGGVLTLSAALPFTGEITVSPYTRVDDDDGWDWKKYYPGIVPDTSKPNVIKVEEVNGNSLSLETFDRLLLQADGRMTTTRVVHANADGTIELEGVAPFSGPEARLSVAHLDFDNPESVSTGSNIADAFINPSRINGMEWMRVVVDPYGELDLRARFEHPVARWITRVGRWVFGGHSYSIIFPGWFFWDNVPHQVATQPTPGAPGVTRNMGHLSQMEQEASASSGDLYAPMSRLNPEDRSTQVVGDLSRFWFWPWGNRQTVTTVQTGRRDSPGVHFNLGQWPILLPSVTAEAGGAAPRRPNDGATTPGTPAAVNPANTGNQLPDALTFRDFTRPIDAATDGIVGGGAAVITPAAFLPAPTAFIPVTQNLERVIGAYAAFSRAGTHRVSVQDNINRWFSAREAHEGGNSFGKTFRQPLLFDITVGDVTVSIGGQSVANDGTVTLMATQRAAVSASPNGDRRHAVGMVSPQSGQTLRARSETEVEAFATGTGEVVEISRVHTAGAGDLDTYGMHLLDGDLHIPVRRLTVDVVDTIPLRMPMPDAASLLADVANANVITSMQPGDVAFLVVPTALRGALTMVTVDGAPPGPNAPTLNQDAADNVEPALNAFLGVEGSVLTVSFDVASPLTAGLDIVLSLDVGRTDNEGTLTMAVRLEP